MNHLLENSRLAGEQRFAYRIRQLLNESEQRIPADRLEQLAAARKAALRVHASSVKAKRAAERVAGTVLATGGGQGTGRFSPEFGRYGLAFASIVLVGAGLIGLFQIEQQQRVEELAEVDAGVLIDDLPISAYADHGFNAFLKQNQ